MTAKGNGQRAAIENESDPYDVLNTRDAAAIMRSTDGSASYALYLREQAIHLRMSELRHDRDSRRRPHGELYEH
jgi:hypothetical protein